MNANTERKEQLKARNEYNTLKAARRQQREKIMSASKPKDTRPNASAAYVQKMQRKAERLMTATEIAAHMIKLGYGIGDITEWGLSVFNANFPKGTDGLLDEQAEREIKNATKQFTTIKAVYVDTSRPEDLIAIEVK